MIHYEYPFNESIRTMLRLEHLFSRLTRLVPREDAVDHHYALATLFEIMDVASRADLKSDLLLELDRQRAQLAGFRGNPSISEAALDLAMRRIDSARERLIALPGKAGNQLAGNEFLMSIRSRISIPGGTCAFDLPAYHAWQHQPVGRRREEVLGWVGTLDPLAEALEVCLALLRETGTAQKVVVRGGSYQQSLGNTRGYQLVRLALEAGLGVVPEISGNRLLLAVRLMRPDLEGRLKPIHDDLRVELTLCA